MYFYCASFWLWLQQTIRNKGGNMRSAGVTASASDIIVCNLITRRGAARENCQVGVGCQEERHGIGRLGVKPSVPHNSAWARGNRREVVFVKRKNNLKQSGMAYLGHESSLALNDGFVRRNWCVLTLTIILESLINSAFNLSLWHTVKRAGDGNVFGSATTTQQLCDNVSGSRCGSGILFIDNANKSSMGQE